MAWRDRLPGAPHSLEGQAPWSCEAGAGRGPCQGAHNPSGQRGLLGNRGAVSPALGMGGPGWSVVLPHPHQPRAVAQLGTAPQLA